MLLMGFVTLGVCMGTLSGLVPGVHVNTLTTVLLLVSGRMGTAVAGLCGGVDVLLLLSISIVAASVAHSFLDFIPSVFIGAPSEGDVLCVLPGHRMLMEGRGLEAVHRAADGSLIGATLAIIVSPAILLAISQPALNELVPWALCFVILAMLASEARRGRIAASACIMCLSGALGLVALHSMLSQTGLVMEGSVLFPLLTGLFGVPTLMTASCSLHVGQAEVTQTSKDLLPSSRGAVAGLLVGWLPGVSATAGSILSLAIFDRQEDDPGDFITMVSSVGTSSVVFGLVTLLALGRARSGTMVAVLDLMDGNVDSSSMALLMVSVLLASAMAYFITLKMGAIMASRYHRINPRLLNRGTLLLIIALVTILNGPLGLAVLVSATLVGMVPLCLGVGRVHLSGALLLPVLIGLAGYSS